MLPVHNYESEAQYTSQYCSSRFVVHHCRCSNCSIRHWWWVPVVAPMVGGAIAAFVYWFFIEAHHTPKQSGPPSCYRVSADDSEEEGLLAHSTVSQEEVN